jgi:predicted proteasome-type protease
MLYRRDSLQVGLRVRLEERDAYLQTIHRLWGGALQKAFYDTVPNPDWSV